MPGCRIEHCGSGWYFEFSRLTVPESESDVYVGERNHDQVKVFVHFRF